MGKAKKDPGLIRLNTFYTELPPERREDLLSIAEALWRRHAAEHPPRQGAGQLSDQSDGQLREGNLAERAIQVEEHAPVIVRSGGEATPEETTAVNNEFHPPPFADQMTKIDFSHIPADILEAARNAMAYTGGEISDKDLIAVAEKIMKSREQAPKPARKSWPSIEKHGCNPE